MVFTLGISALVFAADKSRLDRAVEKTGEYICKTVKQPQISSIGGEWAVIGLARSDEDIPQEYFEIYCKNAEKQLKECGGVLSDKKYTEYSRAALAFTAIGKDPQSIGGYNLLMPLGDYEKTIWQGVNGPIWALIALDSGKYEMPENKDAKTQATRQMYVDYILSCQLDDGGWALTGDKADADVTGMALQALSRYMENENVKNAADRAVLCLSKMQNADGGFSSGGIENAESCAQVMAALCELGINVDDARFVKNGKTVFDGLMEYYTEEKGFKHTKNDSETNLMATEQAFYALVSLQRISEGKNSLYDMSDVKMAEKTTENTVYENSGVVKKKEIINEGRTFADITGCESKAAIEALAQRGIINGKSENHFEPYATMTRAEFAAIAVNALGLTEKGSEPFDDVNENDWYYDVVRIAYNYGIVSGVSETRFNPNGIISREEVSAMAARCAKLCEIDTEVSADRQRDVLSAFTDYNEASKWAWSSLAFCFEGGILDDSVLEIKPKEAVSRAEVAQMIYNLLEKAELL